MQGNADIGSLARVALFTLVALLIGGCGGRGIAVPPGMAGPPAPLPGAGWLPPQASLPGSPESTNSTNGSGDLQDGEVDLGGTAAAPSSAFRLIRSEKVNLSGRVWRPDVVAIGSTLHLAYNEFEAGFKMVQLDLDLNLKGAAVGLFSAHDMATDIRLGPDGRSGFWYAFETAKQQTGTVSCGSNYLHAARYSVDGDSIHLDASQQDLATGCPTAISLIENPDSSVPDDPEAMDDPTPFCHEGQYHIVTRAWPGRGSTVQHVRSYDSRFRLTGEVRLDTGTALPKLLMSQNALVAIDGRVHLVGGFATGGPVGQNTSALKIVPLSKDLTAIDGKPVTLETPGSRYSTRVTRAVVTGRRLLVNYHVQTVRATGGSSGSSTAQNDRLDEYLALYDIQNGYSLLGRVQFQNRTYEDNHSSFAVVGTRVYLFHQEKNQTINARVYELSSGSGER